MAHTEILCCFCLAFSSQIWCSIHIASCNCTSKERLGGLEELKVCFSSSCYGAVTSALQGMREQATSTAAAQAKASGYGQSPEVLFQLSDCWGPPLQYSQKSHRQFPSTALRTARLLTPPLSGVDLHTLCSNLSLPCTNLPVQAIPKEPSCPK